MTGNVLSDNTVAMQEVDTACTNNTCIIANNVVSLHQQLKTTDEDAVALPIHVTVRQQHLSTVGRQEWLVTNTVASWIPSETAIIVVGEHNCLIP